MLVSVIIPAYNSEKYISDAINSVLSQTYQDHEVIVVNDGSKDNTERIIKPYLKRITYLYQDNKGSAEARNTGIKASKGEYIAFLDSDDVWSPEKLSLQVKFLNDHPDFDLVYGDYGTFGENGVIDENFPLTRKFPRPDGYIFQDLFLRPLIFTSTVMLQKKVLEEVGLFDEQFVNGQDYDLWLRIASKHKIGYVPKVIAMYRQHQESAIHKRSYPDKPWEIRVIEKALEMFPEETKKVPVSKLKERLARPYVTLAYKSFYEANYSASRKYFRKYLSLSPFSSRAIIYYLMSCIFPDLILRTIRSIKN